MPNEKLIIKVVESPDELLKAFLVRGIVYMQEQECPYVEEFDQNDFAATQIVGLIDGEPVLTGRIRYFDSFAKIERIAVRPQFRGRGYGHDLLEFMMTFCFRKGFKKLYLHANAVLEGFYRRYGFVRLREEFAFSDHRYVEMALTVLENPLLSLNLEHDPLTLNRPEGKWEEEGPMERSLDRMLPKRPYKAS